MGLLLTSYVIILIVGDIVSGTLYLAYLSSVYFVSDTACYFSPISLSCLLPFLTRVFYA